jgi:hypothetical protein
VTALTREENVEFAGEYLAVFEVAAAVHGLTRLYPVDAVMPSVRAGLISKGVNP